MHVPEPWPQAPWLEECSGSVSIPIFRQVHEVIRYKVGGWRSWCPSLCLWQLWEERHGPLISEKVLIQLTVVLLGKPMCVCVRVRVCVCACIKLLQLCLTL